jgi:hypothetical protein
MGAFIYERIEMRNQHGVLEIVAVTWNDVKGWVPDNADALIMTELLKESGIKNVTVLAEGEFHSIVRKSLGLSN